MLILVIFNASSYFNTITCAKSTDSVEAALTWIINHNTVLSTDVSYEKKEHRKSYGE